MVSGSTREDRDHRLCRLLLTAYRSLQVLAHSMRRAETILFGANSNTASDRRAIAGERQVES